MASTFSGVEISKKALLAQTQALSTVGHNISNLNTDGYSKQRVELGTMPPLHIPGIRPEIPGQIGQGVDQLAIRRQRDFQIDAQIFSNGHKEKFWDTRSKYLSRLEAVYNEVGDSSIRHLLDRYWESWQEVSSYPEQESARIVLLERAETLSAAVRDRHSQLQQIRNMLDEDVVHTTGLINKYASDIAALNKKIFLSQSLGDNPNDWEDRRDLLVEKLSTLINVEVDKYSDPNEYLIHTNGKILVQGDYARQFVLERNANDITTHMVNWADTQEEVDYSGGRLGALVALRDGDVREEIQTLNTFAITLTDGTNELHRAGISQTGETGRDFFVESLVTTNLQGNYDSTGDGVFDQTRLFRMTGNNELKENQIVGITGQITLPGSGTEPVVVEYNANDTVGAIIDRINGSGAEIIAGLDVNNKLSIHATTAVNPENPDFVIRFLEDSGEFFAGYSGMLAQPGPEGAYSWQAANSIEFLVTPSYSVAPFLDPAASMTVNSVLLARPNQVAASTRAQDGLVDVGDGSIALKIAQLRTRNVGFGQEKSFDDYFSDSIATVASKGEDADIRSQTYMLIMDKLRADRSEVSGVNLDEELQDMIKFQTAYGAAARFLTQLNKMYDSLLSVV